MVVFVQHNCSYPRVVLVKIGDGGGGGGHDIDCLLE